MILSSNLNQIAKERGFNPIDSQNLFEAVENECNRDARSSIQSTEKLGSTLEGLRFDPEVITTQAFTFISEMPVAVLTVAIVPQIVIRDQKYIRLIDQTTIQVVNIRELLKLNDFPNFFIVPGWTYVKPDLGTYDTDKRSDIRITLALKGYDLMKNLINQTEHFAPENTWIESVAEGIGRQYKFNSNNLEIGKVYNQQELNFPTSIIGTNSKGSNSTVKFAKHLGLVQIEGVGSGKSLGPVFTRRLN